MSKRVVVKKVKVHRFYKNSISIMMILIGLAIIALMILNLNGVGPTIDLFSLIDELSDKVANGSNYGELDAEALTKPVLTFSSDYDGMLYFRNSSLGNWESSNDKFGKPDLYRSQTVSPLSFYPDKALNDEPKYHIDIKMETTLQKELVVDYSSYSAASNNDCYINAKKKLNEYSMEFSPVLDYTQAQEKGFSNSKLDPLENSYRNHVNRKYLTVDADLKSWLEDFAQRNGIDETSPTVIEDVMEFLKNNYTYHLDVPSSNGEDNIKFFLETSKRGICNNFAAASTMLYRTFGIPARFVNGFLAKSIGDGSVQKMTMISAHAWTEVYIYGSGWFRVDATSERFDLDYPYFYDPANPSNPLVPPNDVESPDSDYMNRPSFDYNSRVSVYYDGLPHSPTDLEDKIIAAKNFPEGYYFETTFSPHVTNLVDAGIYTYLIQIKIFNPDNVNVTSLMTQSERDYIQQGPLIFEIKPRPIRLTSGSANYGLTNVLGLGNIAINYTSVDSTFDQTATLDSTQEVDTSFGVAAKDRLRFTFDNQIFTEPGSYVNSFTETIIDTTTGEDMSSNYSISYTYGIINVSEAS